VLRLKVHAADPGASLLLWLEMASEPLPRAYQGILAELREKATCRQEVDQTETTGLDQPLVMTAALWATVQS